MLRKIEEYKSGHNEAKQDIATYLSNPVNAFLMTKRLTSDWAETVSDMPKNTQKGDILFLFIVYIFIFYFEELSKILQTSTANLTVPTEVDLNGVASALARLQRIYQMSASSIADGVLNGVQYKTCKFRAHL